MKFLKRSLTEFRYTLTHEALQSKSLIHRPADRYSKFWPCLINLKATYNVRFSIIVKTNREALTRSEWLDGLKK